MSDPIQQHAARQLGMLNAFRVGPAAFQVQIEKRLEETEKALDRLLDETEKALSDDDSSEGGTESIPKDSGQG